MNWRYIKENVKAKSSRQTVSSLLFLMYVVFVNEHKPIYLSNRLLMAFTETSRILEHFNIDQLVSTASSCAFLQLNIRSVSVILI